MKAQAVQAEALTRAVTGQTLSNYPAIFQGFLEKGIPEDQIQPRANVFTFQAWKALGRHVRKGEHGVRVLTYIETAREVQLEDGTTEKRASRRPWTTTVFHVSQTEPNNGNGGK
jgi:antirestriction protein ArdC